MKVEKKTMATLLAAVLIAMMGVMPALAAEDTATLTATVLPTLVGITVGDVAFGTVTRESLATSSLDITLTGETGYTAELSATLTDEIPAFYAPLTLNGVVVSVAPDTLFASPASMGLNNYDISFTVPSDATADIHTGTLTIFVVYTP